MTIIISTNRARCALNKKILNLLNEESISKESSASEKSYHECLKGESIAKVQFNFFFIPQTYYIYIYMRTPTPITLPHSCCVCGVINVYREIPVTVFP